MTTKYAYMLSHYEEHGALDPIVTTDRDAVLGMAAEFMEGYPEQSRTAAIGALTALLARSDTELVCPIEKCTDSCGHNLTQGWGGPQFHVVPIFGG